MTDNFAPHLLRSTWLLPHRNLMPSNEESQSKWRQLAEQAANETDTDRLIEIIRQLCDELDARHGPGLGPSKETA